MVPIGDVQDAMRSAEDESDLFDMSSAAFDPVVALQAVTGMKVDSLLYKFPLQGKTVTGLTVKGAKALAARRGNIEVLEPTITNTTIQVETGDGQWVDVPGVRASVRVRDLKTATVFVGIACEPVVMVKRDGSQMLNRNADRVAIAKATRNGILDHFTGVTDAVEQFVVDAEKAGKVYVMGEASEQAEAASRQIAVQGAKRRAMRSQPIGKIGAAIVRKTLTAIEEQAGLKPGFLATDLGTYVQRQWPGLELSDIPAQDRPMLDAWLDEKRGELGLKATDDEQGEAEADTDDATADDKMAVPDPELADHAPALDNDTPEAPEPSPAPAATRTTRTTKRAAQPAGDDGGLSF
jgi:hypothetical protein